MNARPHSGMWHLYGRSPAKNQNLKDILFMQDQISDNYCMMMPGGFAFNCKTENISMRRDLVNFQNPPKLDLLLLQSSVPHFFWLSYV